MLETAKNSICRKAVAALALVVFAGSHSGSAGLRPRRRRRRPKRRRQPNQVDYSKLQLAAARHHRAGQLPRLTSPGQERDSPPTRRKRELDGPHGGDAEKTSAIAKTPFELVRPLRDGRRFQGPLYVADQKVGAIFIFNTETKRSELIKHGCDAHFGCIFGMAIDDDDRLFVADGELHHVLVFDAKHKSMDEIQRGT